MPTMCDYQILIEEEIVLLCVDYTYDSPGPTERGESWDYNPQISDIWHQPSSTRVPDWLCQIVTRDDRLYSALVEEIIVNEGDSE